MNQVAFGRLPRNFNPDCADFMTMAERELSSFFRAVTQLFGPEQAAFSAEDWLHELEVMNGLPTSTRDCRLLTANASTRLASRVPPSSLFTVANI